MDHIKTFNELYLKYRQPFIRFARSYVCEDGVAEDVVNDTFMYYWENINKIEAQNISAYLFRVVRNKCLNHLKRMMVEEQMKAKSNEIEAWELNLKIVTLEACNPEHLLSDELQLLIQKGLNSMSKQTREILIKSRYQSMSNKEIAEQFNISVKSVEYHITKALKTLRIFLKDYIPLFLFC